MYSPNIYSSFVHRSIIEECKSKIGGYFAHRIPDCFSGFVNLYLTDRMVEFTRPLGIRGISGSSNGGGMLNFSDGGKDLLDRFYSEPGSTTQTNFGDLDRVYHPLSIVAEVFTHAKNVLMAADDDIRFNYAACVAGVANDVTRTRGGYHALVQETRNLARRYGVDMSSITFAPEPEIEDPPSVPHGPQFDEKGQCTAISVDGLSCGITDIAQAVRVAAAMMPN
jgi:hypothetical protein